SAPQSRRGSDRGHKGHKGVVGPEAPGRLARCGREIHMEYSTLQAWRHCCNLWRTSNLLLNYLSRAQEQGLWDGDSERLGGLQIDYQLEFGRLLDGEISRSSATKNPVD